MALTRGPFSYLVYETIKSVSSPPSPKGSFSFFDPFGYTFAMICLREGCFNELVGKQTKWCSKKCNDIIHHRNHYIRNRDKILEKQKQHYLENFDRIRQYKREHHIANQDSILEYKRNHYQANRSWYDERDARRRALELGAEGTFTSEDIKWLFIDQEGFCAYCNYDIEDGYHVDHVIPLSRGGNNSRGNIALACPSCNLRKGTKTAAEFAI